MCSQKQKGRNQTQRKDNSSPLPVFAEIKWWVPDQLKSSQTKWRIPTSRLEATLLLLVSVQKQKGQGPYPWIKMARTRAADWQISWPASSQKKITRTRLADWHPFSISFQTNRSKGLTDKKLTAFADHIIFSINSFIMQKIIKRTCPPESPLQSNSQWRSSSTGGYLFLHNILL
jgi:hypothetical protein